jgi:hypothetical protein
MVGAVQLDPPEAAGVTGPWRRLSGRGQQQADPEDYVGHLTRCRLDAVASAGGRTQRRLLATGAVVFAAAERNCPCGDLVGCFP